MSRHLTTEDARHSLNDHAASKALEIREKYGPHIGWAQLLGILRDRKFVRYPCEIAFEAGPLQPGEMACPLARGDQPEAGFTLFVHPLLMTRLELVPHVVLYQLVLVNYGEFATPDDAETFGANALGLSKDAYYQILCGLADEFAPIPV